MATEVILTGTGYPRPHPDRAGPGAMVRCGNCILQFDAGRGTVMRLAALGVSCRQLTALFVTHHHSDHLVALPDVALTRWIARDANRDDAPLVVVAPEGPSARFAERMLEPWADDIAVRAAQTGRSTVPRVQCIPFGVTAEPVEVWHDGPVRVSACAVHHEPVKPAAAYRVDTPDGGIVISGDTRACTEISTLAAGAEVVVHEVIRSRAVQGSFASTVADYHADSVALGELMSTTDVPVLMLTHIIPAPASAADEQALVDEIREGGYRGRVIVGKDLARYRLGSARSG
ncbi:MAG: MBL fold metallo-hydrolase [Gammaproteobacteria bacterium]